MSLDMNPEIRTQWCAALRSGKYTQAKAGLRRDGGYCCLGVLCDLAVKAGVLTPPVQLDSHRWAFAGRLDLLPPVVADWAGIAEENPAVQGGGDLIGLAEENDNGLPFGQIADLIDGGAS
jgi:hypothetical protein